MIRGRTAHFQLRPLIIHRFFRMFCRLEHFLAYLWNRLLSRRVEKAAPTDLLVGRTVHNGEITKFALRMSERRRTEHVAILGKTGSGKSSLLKHFVLQDIEANRGFVFFDLHGDVQKFLLSAVAEEEERRKCDLSNRLIIIEPADQEYSV